MASVQFPEGIEVQGPAYLGGGLQVIGGNFDQNRFDSGGRLKAAYVIHQVLVKHVQPNGTDVVTRTEVLHRARFAGTINAVRVQVPVNPNGGDKQISVECQKSSDGINWSTVLSAPVTFTDADNTAGTTKTATLAVTAYAAGDLIRFAVTASGTTGTQAQGLLCQAELDENGG